MLLITALSVDASQKKLTVVGLMVYTVDAATVCTTSAVTGLSVLL